MPEPSDDSSGTEVEHAEVTAAGRADHATPRVHLRPEAGETKEEFSARLLAAVMERRGGGDPDG